MPPIFEETEDSLGSTREAFIFGWIFILFILSWISVAVVGRAIDNFTFSTLKLNDKSTYHTTIIALVIIAIELATIYYFNSIGVQIYDSSNWVKPSTAEIVNNTSNSNPDTVLSTIDHISNLAKITII